MNEVGESSYQQETEVLNETKTDAYMHIEDAVRLHGKPQLEDGSIVSSTEVDRRDFEMGKKRSSIIERY